MNKIFFSTIIVFIFSSLTFAIETPVLAPNIANSPKEILSDVKAEVKKCAIMTLKSEQDHTNIRSFESTCKSLVLISESQAQVYIENIWYTASIIESEAADSGDLDDMELRDSTGNLIATRKNVPAFDSIVLAMTGGDQKLRTKF
jgi:hypothetical protein